MLQQKKIISLICHHYLSYDFYAGKQEQFITDIQNNRKIDNPFTWKYCYLPTNMIPTNKTNHCFEKNIWCADMKNIKL